MGSSYNFTDDLSKPQYVKSSHLKYYVIDKTDNKQNFINNVKDFCDKYCAPNLTILLKPKWDVYQISLPAATLSDSFRTWNNYIIPIRKDFLNKSNELLARCHVNKEFFDNYPFLNYSSSELLVGYWKVYYGLYFNLTRSIEVSAEPRSDGNFNLKQINVSFINNDEVDLYNLNLRVEANSEDGRELYSYDHMMDGLFWPGSSIIRNFEPQNKVFSDNVTIEVYLYPDYENIKIRPLKKTFTKKNFLKE